MSTTWINRGHFYVPHVTPVIVDCNFVVDSSNANGIGISSLKGQGVQNVFMHTSAAPGMGPNGYLNPNPAAGLMAIQLADNFSRLYGKFDSFISPLSGMILNVDLLSAALTPGITYVIRTVGTTTQAEWQALGVPPGIVAAPGVSFVALISGIGVGNGDVEASNACAIDHIEIIGNPNLMLSPIPMGGSPHFGGWVNMACYLDTVLTAPLDGTIINLALYLSQSSVVVAGE